MAMGILDEIFDVPGWDEEESSILKEAPGDDEQPAGGEEAPADANAGDDANADNNAEDAPEDQNDEDQGEGNQDNDNQQDNYDIDTDTGDDGEEGDMPQQDDQNDAGGGGGNDEVDGGEEASEETQSLKDKYDQLYAELTPEERAYRNMVLKNEYKDLHTLCGNIIMQTGYFPNVATTQDIVKRIIKSLQNFRKYIAFYLTDIYDTKSFYENKYQYEVYLQVFNGIKSVFQELEKMMSHLDEESSKDKK